MTMLDTADWGGKIFTGSWTAATGGTLTSTEPATGQELAQVGLAGRDDVAASAAAARAAQPACAATPGHERAALLRRAARVLEDNRAEFETWLVREGGAVPGKAGFEVGLVRVSCGRLRPCRPSRGGTCCPPPSRAGSPSPSGCRSAWSA